MHNSNSSYNVLNAYFLLGAVYTSYSSPPATPRPPTTALQDRYY